MPLIKKVSSFYTFKEIIPFSAKTGDQIEILEQKINDQIPEYSFHFPPQQVTDASDQFLAAEIIREKLMRSLGQEIPYSLAVRLVMFQREKNYSYFSCNLDRTKRTKENCDREKRRAT